LRSTRANTAITSSLTKKAGDTSAAGSYRTCSNGGSRKDKYDNGKPLTESMVSFKKPIHHGCEQKRK